MKNLIKLLIIILIVFVGCADKKEKAAIKDTMEISLEGMWKLKSGVWENEDGTFMRYPEDSLTEGPAYIIYSKKHYMLIANAPKMNYYRGELIGYSLEGNKLTVSTILSNLENNIGMEAVWTINIKENTLSAENGNNSEFWERVE